MRIGYIFETAVWAICMLFTILVLFSIPVMVIYNTNNKKKKTTQKQMIKYIEVEILNIRRPTDYEIQMLFNGESTVRFVLHKIEFEYSITLESKSYTRTMPKHVKIWVFYEGEKYFFYLYDTSFECSGIPSSPLSTEGSIQVKYKETTNLWSEVPIPSGPDNSEKM